MKLPSEAMDQPVQYAQAGKSMTVLSDRKTAPAIGSGQSKAERGGAEFRHLSFWANQVPAPLTGRNAVPPLLHVKYFEGFHKETVRQ